MAFVGGEREETLAWLLAAGCCCCWLVMAMAMAMGCKGCAGRCETARCFAVVCPLSGKMAGVPFPRDPRRNAKRGIAGESRDLTSVRAPPHRTAAVRRRRRARASFSLRLRPFRGNQRRESEKERQNSEGEGETAKEVWTMRKKRGEDRGRERERGGDEGCGLEGDGRALESSNERTNGNWLACRYTGKIE